MSIRSLSTIVPCSFVGTGRLGLMSVVRASNYDYKALSFVIHS